MRVTNKMLSNNFLSDMNVNLQNMSTLQSQMTSGKQFKNASDDPVKSARAMQLNKDIAASKQYKNNILSTINFLDTTDTALNQIGNVFQSINEKLISAGNASYGPDERKAIKNTINEQVGHLAQILNTNFDGKYIFGGTRGTDKPVIDSVDPITKNRILDYADKNGTSLDVNSINFTDVSKWSGKSISFNVSSMIPTTQTITLGTITATTNTSAAVLSEINNKLASTSSVGTVPATPVLLSSVISATNTANEIKFSLAALPATGTVNVVSTTIGEFSNINYKTMINKNMDVEISQGVTMNYNKTATDVFNFTRNDGTTSDLRTLLSDIIKNLDSTDSADIAKLTNENLSDIKDVMSNLLKVRSEVGSMQNRMDDAASKNTDEIYNLTEILSKTEDIDITEKTMEYATMQTVYMASLQTSAKVLQPTLLDYLR